MCVRALETLTGEEKRLISLLEQADVQMLGSVLTDVPITVLEGYDNYRHYYAPALAAAIASNPEPETAREPMFTVDQNLGASEKDDALVD